jgi:hypothetical protein
MEHTALGAGGMFDSARHLGSLAGAGMAGEDKVDRHKDASHRFLEPHGLTVTAANFAIHYQQAQIVFGGWPTLVSGAEQNQAKQGGRCNKLADFSGVTAQVLQEAWC